MTNKPKKKQKNKTINHIKQMLPLLSILSSDLGLEETNAGVSDDLWNALT